VDSLCWDDIQVKIFSYSTTVLVSEKPEHDDFAVEKTSCIFTLHSL
jgi:hypothetical protein